MDINFDYFYFGPLLARSSVPDEIIKDLNMRAESIAEEYRFNNRLAGQIEKEYRYTDSDVKHYNDLLRPWFKSYVQLFCSHWANSDDVKQLDSFQHNLEPELESIWINYQRKNEYNPIHRHSGDISFVIYSDIPEIIYEEEKFGTGLGPGSIEFLANLTPAFMVHDSNTSSLAHRFRMALMPRDSAAFQPTTGNILIFPSYLTHHVARFQSDVVRTTVAGNVYFREKG